MNELKSLLYIIAMELDLANAIATLKLPNEVAVDTETMTMLGEGAAKIRDAFEHINIEDKT